MLRWKVSSATMTYGCFSRLTNRRHASSAPRTLVCAASLLPRVKLAAAHLSMPPKYICIFFMDGLGLDMLCFK